MVGLGEPRVVRAGVVGGSYFEVMGLRPTLGRLLDATDDGPKAAGVAVLTHRFWTHDARRAIRRSIGKTIRLGDRSATIVGVLAAVGAVSGGDRDHRQRGDEPAPPGRDDGGRPRAPDDGAVRAACARRGRRAGASRAAGPRTAPSSTAHPRGVSGERRLSHRGGAAARSDHLAGADGPAGAAGGVRAGLRHRVLERGEPDPGAVGAPRGRAGHPRGARRERGRAAADAAGREPGAVRRRRRPRRAHRAADGGYPGALRLALLGARARPDGQTPACCGWASASPWSRRCCSRSCRGCPRRTPPTASACPAGSVRITSGTNRRLRLFAVTQIAASFVLLAGAGMLVTTLVALQARRHRLQHAQGAGAARARVATSGHPSRLRRSTREVMRRIAELPGVRARGGRHGGAVARRRRSSARASSSRPRATPRRTAKRIRARGSAPCRQASSRRSACRSSPAATSPRRTARTREQVVIISQSVAQRMFSDAGRR